jgi:hypothetical protein
MAERGGPGQAVRPVIFLDPEHPLVSGEVDHCRCPVIAPLCRIVQEGDLISFRRDARVADPAGCLVQNVAHWIFELVVSLYVAHHREILSIRRPVRLLYVFNYLAGRAAERLRNCDLLSIRYGDRRKRIQREGQVARRLKSPRVARDFRSTNRRDRRIQGEHQAIEMPQQRYASRSYF